MMMGTGHDYITINELPNTYMNQREARELTWLDVFSASFVEKKSWRRPDIAFHDQILLSTIRYFSK